jgi:YHS domain-containing protein
MRLSLLLMWAAVAVVILWPLLRHLASARGTAPARRQTFDELVKDPVCQTYVVRSRALSRIVDGVQRHFCSEQCARQFTGPS